MKNLCWNLEMVQVIPGKYLLQTRKRIGLPPAPASTNWENQPVISSWYEHKAAFCYSQRLQTLLQTYWILAVWLGTLGRSPGDVFCISLVAKIEEGTVLFDSVFWVPAYLLFQLHGQREPLKEDQAWLSWSSKLLQLFISWTYWAWGFSQFLPHNICLL